ncbi:hypothetical protein [Priestia megaterium]|uniref:hypothetical protein n=1 Tax=Priestia megaterium TaxID=1404 RepID=UPI002D7FE71F|nr:hypothetical protein [Priestia megaterium]MEB4861012.1 hypothetical protein [Priestia megaterium]
MIERIKLLKDYLPKFILNNASLYGILSKGVHELDETTCLKLFPMMKAAIEIILDEKIYKKEQEEKLKNVSQYIHTTAGEFK